jgi:uncharacterized damage-inducible protein DinB
MKIDIASIQNPQVRHFYTLWWSQHQIAYDFYSRLEEAQYDFRMVDTPERKADTPRQSLAHILYVNQVYLNSVRTGKLEFKSFGTEHYATMTKEQLLDEWERVDQEMFATLTSQAFESQRPVEVPWGGAMGAVDVLFFLRDHDILHIGWNLAVMDHLNLPRFASLIKYWGP